MTTYTYIVTRTVVETIEVEAQVREQAVDGAIASPPALWTRDITEGEHVVGRINPKHYQPPYDPDDDSTKTPQRGYGIDLTERDQAEAAIKRVELLDGNLTIEEV